MQHEVTVEAAVAARARRAVERMIAVGRGDKAAPVRAAGTA
jgi:hypothetical protein